MPKKFYRIDPWSFIFGTDYRLAPIPIGEHPIGEYDNLLK